MRFSARNRNREMYAYWIVMQTLGCLVLMSLWLGGAAKAQAPAPGEAGSKPQVVRLEINDEIEPIMAEYIDGGIGAGRARARQPRADHDGYARRADRPPCRTSSSTFCDSPVPVAVYVSPAGSRGASAGFFILLSADIAAMAPGTHTGAASPLLAIGGVPTQRGRDAEEENHE